MLDEKSIVLDTYHPQTVKHITKFENLNDFYKKPDADQVASRVETRNQKKNPSEMKIKKDSVYN